MSEKWYSLKKSVFNAAGDTGESTAELLIYGDIGSNWYEESVTAVQLVKDLQALGTVDKIIVRINSIGGSVPDGLAIYNALKRNSATIVTCIDGMAMSVASLIAMAGDTLQMAENAILMIHAPWMYAGGNATQLREMADILDTWAGGMATSYANKTGKTKEECLALLTDGIDHYFTAEEALASGWIDEISDAQQPAAQAALRSIAEARFSVLAKSSSNPAAAAAKPSPKENAMPTVTQAAAQPTADEIRAQALADDQKRRSAISASAAPFIGREGMADLVAKLQGDTGTTAEEANRQILAALSKNIEPAAGHHVTVEDTGRTNRINDMVDALLVRAGVASNEIRARVQKERNPFRADSLMDLARASLDRSGANYRGKDKMELVAAAFTQSGSDFPILLENAMFKALQAGYALQADTWTRFCKRGSVNDFRAHPRYRIGSLGNLDALNELGEFKNKAIPDGEKASIAATTKGNIINISRQIVVNDDLGAFIGLADMLGRAAKRTVEADVYALLALNSGLGPALLDGKPLFDAAHKNIGTASALSVDGLDGDRVLIGSQKDVSGNDFLSLNPQVLLVPLALGGTARVTIGAEYDPDTANKLQRPNKVKGMVSDIVDTPRLEGTRRYMFADPQTAPVIEVVFLDGNDMPYLETQDGFDVDGSRHKVRYDYGVGATDYRGAVTNAGA